MTLETFDHCDKKTLHDQKIRFSEKVQIFRMSDFGKKSDFLKDFRFKEKIQIFGKISDFRKNFRFSKKFQIFGKKIRFLDKF